MIYKFLDTVRVARKMIMNYSLLQRMTTKSFRANRRCINSSALTITQSTDVAAMPPQETLKFGRTFTPHMLTISFSLDHGWADPEIKPYEFLSISPASSCVNYGMQCFEGMKAYRTLNPNDENDESLRLFRPDLNMKRLSNSMERISLPGHDFDGKELIKCMKKLISLEKDWVPKGEGYSLYLRPNVLATNSNLGEGRMESVLLYVITSPVGPYYKGGFEPVRLICESNYVRAWSGGTGASKVGGNYAPALKPTDEAQVKGYNQVLWLMNGDVTEVGSMNIFLVFDIGDGKKEIVTPPLSRGDILPGVTRNSISQLARTWEGYEMVERNVSMDEVASAIKAGKLVEAFGAGTAAVVCPIECINYNGEDLEIPATGKATQRAWDELLSIQYGKIDHEWSDKFY